MISILHLLEHSFDQRQGGVENFVSFLTKTSTPGLEQFLVRKAKLGGSYSLLQTLFGKKNFRLSAKALEKGLEILPSAPKDLRSSIFHIHQILPYGLKTLVQLSRQVPCVFTLHDYFPFCQKVHFYPYHGGPCSGASVLKCSSCVGGSIKSPFLIPFFLTRNHHIQEYFQNVRALILPNDDLIEQVPCQFRSKTRVVPYSVPSCEFEEVEKSDALVFLGSIRQHKGIFVLIKELEDSGFQGNLDIYGPVDQNLSLSNLPSFARYKGILKNRSELKRYKAMVLPSLWKETGPLVVLEALEEGIRGFARKGSLSSTYSQSKSIHFYSHASEILSMNEDDEIETIKGLQSLQAVRERHREIYEEVWESWYQRNIDVK